MDPIEACKSAVQALKDYWATLAQNPSVQDETLAYNELWTATDNAREAQGWKEGRAYAREDRNLRRMLEWFADDDTRHPDNFAHRASCAVAKGGRCNCDGEGPYSECGGTVRDCRPPKYA